MENIAKFTIKNYVYSHLNKNISGFFRFKSISIPVIIQNNLCLIFKNILLTKSEISFNTMVDSIKNILDLALLNPKTHDKFGMLYTSYNALTNSKLCIPVEAGYYRLQVIQYIRTKLKNEGLKISDEFIVEELYALIFEIKLDKKLCSELGKTIKTWLERLKKLELKNLRFILPVNNVSYRKDIEFDNIKLKKLTADILKKNIPFHIDDRYSTPEKELESLKTNKTDIFAIIDVQSQDNQKGYVIAKEKLKKLIHAMRLFDPPSGITEREFYFPPTHYDYIMVNLDEKSYTTSGHNLHLNAYIHRTKKYWENIQPDWVQLCTFLYSEIPNQLESLILTALYWYGDAGKETEDNLSKFLKYMHGLETLLIFDNKYDKGERMAIRLASINSKKNSHNYDFYKNLMNKYFKFRSGMIHSGKLEIDSEDVLTTHEWLRNLIFEYIRFSKKYSEIDSLFQNEFNVKIS